MRRPWLAPLTPLYAAGLAWRNLRLNLGWERVQRLHWPVISIGNLSTGGSGKTPLAIALAKLLMARGLRVDVLSRGYGRSSSEAARVDPNGTADQFGDEPLLIAREADVPVYVASRRYDAGLLAEAAAGSNDVRQQSAQRSHITAAHILDDGYQHRQLFRDVDILLLNREDWSDGLLPSGNLRDSLHAATRASVVAIPADDPEFEKELLSWGWTGPVWRLRRHMEVPHIEGPVTAFCGIARSEQFFSGLQRAGLTVAVRNAFRDHHRYTQDDLARLVETARSTGSKALITTQKDAVRLQALASIITQELPLYAAQLNTEIEDEASALDWLVARLTSVTPQPTV